ncbi:MAG: 30S ribosomal protein S8 [Proteobacteria bacterium]|nr:MAG: 30S ribosomal protein S8 [Pseudomonadota bacterium]
MQITDPIADLLTRIRNAQKAGHEVVSVPASKMKIAVTHILKEQGFVRNYKAIRDNKQGILKIALAYNDKGRPGIQEIKRVSTPSKRVYVSASTLPFVKNGFGVGIISTPTGIMTDREARKNHLGGEFICSVF